jgi:hypothetical protein
MKNAYDHQKKYNLKIDGMKSCIHCYFSYISYKFANDYKGEKLSKAEEECLLFYLTNFVNDHNTTKCTRTQYGGKCLLCDAKLGIYPIMTASANIKENMNPLHTDQLYATAFTCVDDFVINDVIVVDPITFKTNDKFVLVL